MSAITEDDWSDLLAKVRARSVVPIVGPDLVEVAVDGRTTSLDEHLASRLAVEFGLSPGPDPPRTLHSLACAQLARDPRRSLIDSKLSRCLGTATLAIPQALRELARIEDFTVYVSTTCDGMLAAALEAERGGRRVNVLSYSPSSRCDLPRRIDEVVDPTVFHLLGRAAFTPEYALTDRDVVEYLHELQSSAHRPPNLFDAFANKHLLLIGTRLTDWLARFFVRLVRSQRFDDPLSKSQFIVDPAVSGDGSLQQFFLRLTQNANVLPATSAAEFVAELARRLAALPRSGTPAAPTKVASIGRAGRGGAVFISYAGEDGAAAMRLHDALVDRGVDVWLDKKRLQPGADWNRSIEENIARCSVFVALVSRSTASALNLESYFRREWNLAAGRVPSIAPGVEFIIPVRLDDTALAESRPPDAFRQRQWVDLPDGRADAAFVDLIAGLQQEYIGRGGQGAAA